MHILTASMDLVLGVVGAPNTALAPDRPGLAAERHKARRLPEQTTPHANLPQAATGTEGENPDSTKEMKTTNTPQPTKEGRTGIVDQTAIEGGVRVRGTGEATATAETAGRVANLVTVGGVVLVAQAVGTVMSHLVEEHLVQESGISLDLELAGVAADVDEAGEESEKSFRWRTRPSWGPPRVEVCAPASLL